MATIAEVKTKIESANALGIANLTEKGVEIGANATTYEIMKNIAEVAGGGGQYKSVNYNGDNTVTLVDKKGVYHVIECEYTNNKLTGVTYDGSPIELTYDGGVLTAIGKTTVDMANAPITGTESIASLDHTVTFTVDGEPYEVVSVKDGVSVNAPTEPTKDGSLLLGWESNNEIITFPITPTEDIELVAKFNSILATIYNHFNVDNTVYPYVVFYCQEGSTSVGVYFIKTYSISGTQFNYSGLRGDTTYTGEISDTVSLINAILSTSDITFTEKSDWFLMKDIAHFHANFEMPHSNYYPLT